MPILITDWHPREVLETLEEIRRGFLEAGCTPAVCTELEGYLVPLRRAAAFETGLSLLLGTPPDYDRTRYEGRKLPAIDLLHAAQFWCKLPEQQRNRTKDATRRLAATLALQYGLLINTLFKEVRMRVRGKAKQEGERIARALANAASSAIKRAERKNRPVCADPRCRKVSRQMQEFIRSHHRIHPESEFCGLVLAEISLLRSIEAALERPTS